MALDPVRNHVRKQRRKRKLGLEAKCIYCGYSKPEGLLTAANNLLEDHHVFGKNHDPEVTATVCRNHHAEVSEGQRDAGADLQEKTLFLAPVVPGDCLRIVAKKVKFIKVYI